MMKRVVRILVSLAGDVFKTELPTGAKFLHVNTINDQVYLWVEIDDGAEKLRRYDIEIYSDRAVFHPGAKKYIGTTKIGAQWLHFYEIV